MELWKGILTWNEKSHTKNQQKLLKKYFQKYLICQQSHPNSSFFRDFVLFVAISQQIIFNRIINKITSGSLISHLVSTTALESLSRDMSGFPEDLLFGDDLALLSETSGN